MLQNKPLEMGLALINPSLMVFESLNGEVPPFDRAQKERHKPGKGTGPTSMARIQLLPVGCVPPTRLFGGLSALLRWEEMQCFFLTEK